MNDVDPEWKKKKGDMKGVKVKDAMSDKDA